MAVGAVIFDESKLLALIEEAVRRVLGGPRLTLEDRYLSTAKAAERADVAPETIREWQIAGRLGTYWAGRERRVLLSELDALMKKEPKRAARVPTAAPEVLARRRFRRAG